MTTTHPTDPMRAQVNAARRLARVVAGDDDAQFVRTMNVVLNAIDAAEAQAAPAAPSARPISGRRRAAPLPPSVAPPAPTDSVYHDPRFLANERFVANSKWVLSSRRRIIGGVRTSEFPDCVAIGDRDRWCCSGTLIAPSVVVTAGHCVTGGCADRVFLGENVDRPRDGREIGIANATAHPKWGLGEAHFDIAVLTLEKPVADVMPRAIAPAGSLAAARSVRVVGYGTTDPAGSIGYGLRRVVDVPLAGPDPTFGADTATEFVAGAPMLDRDSCSGDSGGPAYVQLRSGWALAGATSRGTDSARRTCGDGGVYTLVAAHQDWLSPYLAAGGGGPTDPSHERPRSGRRH